MNIREDELIEYLQVFLKTLDTYGQKFFDKEQSDKLFHLSLLPSKIICYVSTQFGVAFEYIKDDKTKILSRRGSARIEEILLGTPNALNRLSPFMYVGKGAKFKNGTIEGYIFPFRLGNEDDDFTLVEMKFECKKLGWSRYIRYAEIYGNREKSFWSVTNAESRAKDQILAALHTEKQAKSLGVSIYEYVNKFKERSVLVLGSYSPDGLEKIDRICGALKQKNYEPVLIKDVPDFEQYDLHQKVAAVGSVVRFIIIENSIPSGHLNEIDICKDNNWVTIILRNELSHSSAMTLSAEHYSKVIIDKKYTDKNIEKVLEETLNWAEKKLIELKKEFDDLYPWREEKKNI